MEICKIKISKELLQMLVDSNALTTNDFQTVGVDEKDFDYKGNDGWLAAKKASDKAYKKLKKIEFNLRNK